MPSDTLPKAPALDDRTLKLIQDKLANTLDMLDFNGVSGVIALCLLPAGASFYAAGGNCLNPRGAAAGLYAAITTIHELAEKQEDAELAETLGMVAALLEPLTVPGQGHHVH